MKVYSAKTDLKFNFNGYDFELKKGEKLLFADDVFALLPKNLKTLFKEEKAGLPPFYRGENLSGKTLLVVAQAAIGDALCMTPALREIKRRYPDCQLFVSISGRARPVLENLPYIDKLLPMPIPYKFVSKANYMVKVIEMVNTPQFDNLNLVEYFLWKCQVFNAEDETPDVVVDQNIVSELKSVFDQIREASGGKKVLLFHYLASSVHRSLPPKLLKEIEPFIEKEYVPVLCSLPTEDVTLELALEAYEITSVNLSSLMKDIRYLIAAVYLSDAVITADTATLHIAAGLKKPTVLISGPIDGELRARTYLTVVSIPANYRGQTCVAPCMKHTSDGPCPEARVKHEFYSPCIQNIPARVVYYALKDAELLVEKDYPKPEKCPVCEYSGEFPLFEVINQSRMFECPSCGLQFPYPIKAAEYDKVYDEKTEYIGLLDLKSTAYQSFKEVSDEKSEVKKWLRVPRFTVLQAILDKLPKGKLFDVGCSTGFFLLIAKKFGFDVYGMEASSEAVEIAKRNFKLKVAQALTFDELPEDFKGPYKVVSAFEVLEHVEEPMKFLQGIYKLLEDDEGYLLLSCPPFYNFENLAKGYRKFKWWFWDFPPHHLTRWKPWTLFYALKSAGFSQVYIFTESLIPGTVLEGVTPPVVTINLDDGRAINLDTTGIILETLKPLYLNSRYLGNFQCALAVKGKSSIDWERVIHRAIRFSAVEIIWGYGDEPKNT
jgi:ADP-heptose:LPS heptosyltransferase/2-polyprenyl-3-methyl-5-hydroxy-6-metoxy-1,4-benzoquinol methylase